MKKLIILLLMILLCGCSEVVYFDYDNDIPTHPENEVYEEYNDVVLFCVEVNSDVKKINIRSTPYKDDSNNNVIGSASAGDVFFVYDEVYNDGYTWYRISQNEWIANNGSWLSMTGMK